jgi:Na+-driven multidrug efflux pump
MGIINSYAMLILMSIIAVNMASQPIIGFNYGAGNFKRVKDTLMICLIAGTIISISGFLAAELFPETIVNLFNKNDDSLKSIGVPGLRIFMAAWGIVGFQIIASSYFQAVGKAGLATVLSMLRQVIILIPALFILPDFFNIRGVWLSAPLSDIIAGSVFAFFLIKEIKKINNKIATMNTSIL